MFLTNKEPVLAKAKKKKKKLQIKGLLFLLQF